MKHAEETALAAIKPVLSFARLKASVSGSPVFLLEVLGFHSFSRASLFADVRTNREWLRLPVTNASERRQLVRLVPETLGARKS